MKTLCYLGTICTFVLVHCISILDTSEEDQRRCDSSAKCTEGFVCREGICQFNLDTFVVEPDILVRPETVDFGRVRSGTTVTKNVSVTNVGDDPLHINYIGKEGSSDFILKIQTEDGFVPGELILGESFDIQITYTPVVDGSDTGAILIFSDDGDENQTRINILGNLTPVIKVDPQNIDFGEVFVGSLQSQTVTVTNLGQELLELYSIELMREGPDIFLELPNFETQPIQLTNLESITFQVSFAPLEQISYPNKILLTSNDSAFSSFEVELFGRGGINSCPHSILTATVQGIDVPSIVVDGGEVIWEGEPLQTIRFDASESTDLNDSIAEYMWTLVERPEDSGTRFQPSNIDAQTTLFLDLAGTYVIELSAYDTFGMASCNTPRLTIMVIPRETIHVQLVWDTPNDTVNDECASIWDECGSDLDLHLLHRMANEAWNQAPYDCYFQNKIPNWGDVNIAEDDPSMDIDDVNGFGPEIINLDLPEPDHDYHVGVYYYDDHGWGPSYVTVRIYINGTMIEEYADQLLETDQDFWFVGTIHWTGETAIVTPVDQVTQGFP